MVRELHQQFIKKGIDEKVCIFFYYTKKIVQMDMSFNSRIEEREIIINTRKGSLKADLINKNIIWYNNNKPKLLFKTKQNNLDMLNEQMGFFLNSVKNNKKINNVIKSLEVIKIVSLIRQSSLNNKKVKI